MTVSVLCLFLTSPAMVFPDQALYLFGSDVTNRFATLCRKWCRLIKLLLIGQYNDPGENALNHLNVLKL